MASIIGFGYPSEKPTPSEPKQQRFSYINYIGLRAYAIAARIASAALAILSPDRPKEPTVIIGRAKKEEEHSDDEEIKVLKAKSSAIREESSDSE